MATWIVGGSATEEPPIGAKVHFYDLPVAEQWVRTDAEGSVWSCDRYPTLKLTWVLLLHRYARPLIVDYLPPMPGALVTITGRITEVHPHRGITIGSGVAGVTDWDLRFDPDMLGDDTTFGVIRMGDRVQVAQ